MSFFELLLCSSLFPHSCSLEIILVTLRSAFLIVLILSASITAYAGEVTATGEGSTKESAIHNAMRSAIEKEIQ